MSIPVVLETDEVATLRICLPEHYEHMRRLAVSDATDPFWGAMAIAAERLMQRLDIEVPRD